MEKNLIDRINQLARKQKAQGLTDQEKTEQMALRQDYLNQFRKQMKAQIEGIRVFDPQGNEITPDKVKHLQDQKKSEPAQDN